jgi:hypothetical protein
MNDVITVKVISNKQTDFQSVAKALESKYEVLATSTAIFDKNTGAYHMFLSLLEEP